MKARKEKNRFLLRLDPEVHRGLTRLSKTQNVSMNALCSRFIEDGLRAGDLNQKWMKEIVSAYQDDELLALILFGSQARGEATASLNRCWNPIPIKVVHRYIVQGSPRM